MRTALAIAFCLLTVVQAVAKDPCAPKEGFEPEQMRLGPCRFDVGKRAFEGSPSTQVDCLLRSVEKRGTIGKSTATDALRNLVGTPFPVPLAKISAYLIKNKIDDRDIGGALTSNVDARYFIIHDTSSPNCSEGTSPSCPVLGQLPGNINDPTWPSNRLPRHPEALKNRHAMTNRLGQSVTARDFSKHISSVKFDYCQDAAEKKNLFIGIENIQPRIGEPAIVPHGQKLNDRIAPDPGFSDAQYRRLALLYIVASARHKEWMIPAFHAVIDNFYNNGHDDPQNFDTTKFSDGVMTIKGELERET